MDKRYIDLCVYELEGIDQKYARQVLRILEAYRYRCDKERQTQQAASEADGKK